MLQGMAGTGKITLTAGPRAFPWQQLGTGVQLLDASSAPVVAARGEASGEDLAAGPRCVSSAPSCTHPGPQFVVWLERYCCWMGMGAVPLGAGCGVGAALLVVADVAHSPLQDAKWAPLNMFPKPRSGPRMVATSHCLDLMIRLVQQVRDCQGSVHPPGLGQDLGGSGMLLHLWQRMSSLQMNLGGVPRFGGVNASALLPCTAGRGQQLADAVAM